MSLNEKVRVYLVWISAIIRDTNHIIFEASGTGLCRAKIGMNLEASYSNFQNGGCMCVNWWGGGGCHGASILIWIKALELCLQQLKFTNREFKSYLNLFSTYSLESGWCELIIWIKNVTRVIDKFLLTIFLIAWNISHMDVVNQRIGKCHRPCHFPYAVLINWFNAISFSYNRTLMSSSI